MLEMEDRLKERQEIINRYQSDLTIIQQDLQDKSQVEALYDEAIERYKQEINQKDIGMRQLQLENSKEREIRQREEEHNK